MIDFPTAYEEGRWYTLLSRASCQVLFDEARACRRLEGHFAELGVYRGGSARIIERAVGRGIHLFDTFAGIPGTALPTDGYKAGDFAASYSSVRAFLSTCRVTLWEGLFPGTAEQFVGERFAFVFVDVDIEQSVADALAFFVPRLSPGGTILFDDWGDPRCPGVKKAILEYVGACPDRIELETFASVPFAAVRRPTNESVGALAAFESSDRSLFDVSRGSGQRPRRAESCEGLKMLGTSVP